MLTARSAAGGSGTPAEFSSRLHPGDNRRAEHAGASAVQGENGPYSRTATRSVWARQLKVTGSHFTGNRCDASGPDLGGAAIRALSQYQNRPVYVVGSTFTGGVCSNGGALSSIGVSWVIQGSTLTGNRAIGRGANPGVFFLGCGTPVVIASTLS